MSPDDETYEKFGFYAAHGVDELVVADPATRTDVRRARGATCRETPESTVLGVSAVAPRQHRLAVIRCRAIR